jgi:hypothetical protein
MNNEPVAWMHQNPDYAISKHQSLEFNIPLYIHPVKKLTDEDIDIALYVADITLNNLSDGDISMERIKAFVRTILRKAQENG